MLKNKMFRRLALLFSLLMLLTSTVNTTFCFIVTKTDSIVNTFTPFDSVGSDLLISKTVEHPLGEEYVIPDHISFDFKVDFGSLYANTMIKTTAGTFMADENGSITVSVKPGKAIGIEDIDAGTKVTITELQKEGDGFSVKEDAVMQETTVSEEGNVNIEFVNVYTPASVQPANVTVVGTKILEGREWQNGDTFSFILEQKTEGNTWKTLGTKTVAFDAENTAFNTFDFSDLVQAITFDRVGIYTFRMTEVIGDLDNVDYDETVNHFTVKVTDADMDGKLEIGTVAGTGNAKVTGENGKYTVSVTFNNTFVPVVLPDPDPITVNIEVNKTVNNTGTQSIGPAGFEFVLEDVAAGEKLAMTSDASGKAIFGLTFSKADIDKTFTYRLAETNEGMYGMTYDTDVYEITVSVSLSEENKLTAAVTMNGTAAEVLVAEFENTYHADRSDVPPAGDNTNIAFWFTMMIVSGTACVVLVLLDKRYSLRAKH